MIYLQKIWPTHALSVNLFVDYQKNNIGCSLVNNKWFKLLSNWTKASFKVFFNFYFWNTQKKLLVQIKFKILIVYIFKNHKEEDDL